MYKTAKMEKLCGFGVVQGLAASLHLASIEIHIAGKGASLP